MNPVRHPERSEGPPTPMIPMLLLFLSVSACTLGPKPELRVVEAEVESPKEVGYILVVPTTGTGTFDPKEKINLSVPGGAYRRYKDKIFVQQGLTRTAKTLGMPEGAGIVMPVSWQVAFYQWIKDFQKLSEDERETVALEIEPPPRGKKIPTAKEVEKLAKVLKSRKRGIRLLRRAVKSGKVERMAKAAKRAAKTLKQIGYLNQHLFDRLEITHMLLSHFDGSKKAWNAEKPQTLYVALVDLSTGRFRYFSMASGQKGDVPTTFEGFIDIMSINIFDAIASEDGIEVE